MKKELIKHLKLAAQKIYNYPESYNWKAIGACNCGILVQQVTNFSAKEISNYGIEKHGDWTSLANIYQEKSNFEIDKIISKIISTGFELKDFRYLENLNDPEILEFMGNPFLKRDEPKDVVNYINAWVTLLEQKNNKEQYEILVKDKVQNLELV